MIPDFTRDQLADLQITASRPLVICDVDEVVVHFTRSFEEYIGKHSLYLDTSSFALNGNVRKCDSDAVLEQIHIDRLIDDFFIDCTETLPPIDGAVAALHALSEQASIVMLTNLPHHAREKRINNLRSLGITFPVVTNSGPKGPAIRHLATLTNQPVVFVDDSPNFIASSYAYAPHVHLVHFLQDERFARHLNPLPYVSLRTNSWAAARPHIQNLMG